MTRKEFTQSVYALANSMINKNLANDTTAKNIYKNIIIDRSHQIISTSEFGFFAQGEDAQFIIDQIPSWMNEKKWLIFYLSGCGEVSL